MKFFAPQVYAESSGIFFSKNHFPAIFGSHLEFFSTFRVPAESTGSFCQKSFPRRFGGHLEFYEILDTQGIVGSPATFCQKLFFSTFLWPFLQLNVCINGKHIKL